MSQTHAAGFWRGGVDRLKWICKSILLAWVGVGCGGRSYESESDIRGNAADGARAGALDRSFASKGYVLQTGTASSDFNQDYPSAVAIDSNNRIVVAGRSVDHFGASVAIVWRLLDSGSFDSAFGSNGGWWATHTPGEITDAEAIAVDSKNGIVVAGYGFNVAARTSAMTLWLVEASGALDPNFAAAGVLVSPAANSTAYGVAVDPSGSAVATGDADRTMATWRYSPGGVPDNRFGTGGVVHSAAASTSSEEVGFAIAIDSNGRLIVAGSTRDTPNDSRASVWRFTTAGVPDTTFGLNGQADFGGIAGGGGDDAYDTTTALVVDELGRPTFAGFSNDTSGNPLGFIARLSADGTPDESFGERGFLLLRSSAGDRRSLNTSAASVAVDSQGRFVIAGRSADDEQENVAVWRCSNFGQMDGTFGNRGIFSMTGTADPGGTAQRSSDAGVAVAIDEWDRPVIVGSSFRDQSNGNFVVWRLTP